MGNGRGEYGTSRVKCVICGRYMVVSNTPDRKEKGYYCSRKSCKIKRGAL